MSDSPTEDQPASDDAILTNKNWDTITQKKYHIDFLNERNAVRAVLYDLLQIENEIKCTNVEIQALKTNFDSQLGFLETEVQRLEENEYLDPDQKAEYISELVKKIEETNSKFSQEVEKYQLQKEQKCQDIGENIERLFQLKSKFKETHQNQVESLKRFRNFCKQSIRSAVENRLKSVDRKFCDELFYIASCEQGLKQIFSLIDDKSSHSGVCLSVSSTQIASDACTDFFTDFAWMRNEQLVKRSELYDYFKKYLAKDLTKALAAVHVYKPDEPIKFIANFLKHLKQNEFRLTKQEQIFYAAKHGEILFPEQN